MADFGYTINISQLQLSIEEASYKAFAVMETTY